MQENTHNLKIYCWTLCERGLPFLAGSVANKDHILLLFFCCWHWSGLNDLRHLRMSGTKCESRAFRTQDWGYESKNTGLHGNSVILSTRSSGQMHISVFFQSFRFFLQSGPLSRPGWPCYDLVRLKQPWKGYQSWRVEGHSCKKRGCFTAKELDGVRKVSLQHQDVKECV